MVAPPLSIQSRAGAAGVEHTTRFSLVRIPSGQDGDTCGFWAPLGQFCERARGVIPGSTCCTRPPRILPHFHPGSCPRADIALYETTCSGPPQEELSTRTAWPR